MVHFQLKNTRTRLDDDMKKNKLIHVSFDEVEQFIPRIPEQICPGEDNTIPRICAAPSVIKALQAIPQAGEVIYYMQQIGAPVIIHAYYLESQSVLTPDQIADKVPDALATGETWITEIPVVVRRFDYEIVNPFIIKKKDGNGTVERFLVGYDSLKRVDYQDNWRNLARNMGRGKRAEDYFMSHKPDLTYRCFMSNLDDDLLKLLGVNLMCED